MSMNDLIGFSAKLDKQHRITVPQETRQLLKLKSGITLYLLIDISRSEVSKEFLGKTIYMCSNCRNTFDEALFDRYLGVCPRCNGSINKQEIPIK